MSILSSLEGQAAVECQMRLRILKGTPGWRDVIALGQALTQEAMVAVLNDTGFDAQHLQAMHQKARGAKEFWEALLGDIDEAIVRGGLIDNNLREEQASPEQVRADIMAEAESRETIEWI